MNISFGPLTTLTGTGTGAAQVHVRARGFAPEVAASGAGGVLVALRAYGEGYADYGTPAPPVVPGAGHAVIEVTGRGRGFARSISGQGQATVAVTARGYGAVGGAGVGQATVRLTAVGYGTGLGFGYLFPPAPLMSAYGDLYMHRTGEALVLGGAADQLPIPVLKEKLTLGQRLGPVYSGAAVTADQVQFHDRATPIVHALASDTLVMGALAAGDQTMFVRTVERLLLSGEASSLAEAVAIVTDALVLGALIDAYQVGYAQETLLLGETIDSLYQAFARVVERMLLGASAAPSYLAMAVVRETMVFGDAPMHEAELTALVRESIGFAANIRLDTGDYIAWVLNTESKGLTRYTNYPFNSFAKIGGRYVGCSPQGLHWLDGDTDDGAEIHARLRLGVDDMGTRRLKNIPEAFIGYTSDGVLLMRAIYTDEASGERVAAIYRLSPREATNKREHRFKLGRGLKAVDWDFEIENVDGSDFELSNVEFRPLVLNRRTRG